MAALLVTAAAMVAASQEPGVARPDGPAQAVMGAFNFVGTLGSGWLTDRVDPRRLLLA